MTAAPQNKNPRPAMVVYTTSETMTPSRILVYKTTPTHQLTLHIFEPPGHKPSDKRPCAIALHGGGWTNGDPWLYYAFANKFAALGMVGISVQYRLMTPDGITPFDCVKDGRSVMRYLKANAATLGIDPDKIVATGGSAGAHVAAGAEMFDGIDEASDDLSISPRPAALILYFPVIDTSKESGYGSAKCGPDWQKISPAHNVRPGTAPTLVIATKEDTVTPYRGVERFKQAMAQSGNHYDSLIKETGPHGYFLYDLDLFQEVMLKSESFLKKLKIIP